ncbi:MAG: transcriptional regulator [Pseudomonas sp.]|nr:transcriptional regulator [Pseudomonas sp.]
MLHPSRYAFHPLAKGGLFGYCMFIQLPGLPVLLSPVLGLGRRSRKSEGYTVVNVEQLKNSVNRMSVDVVREAVHELRLDGLVTEGKTPFNKVHFNTCFAEIEALFQRAGYHRQLDVVGYQGLLYALYDPVRWEAVDVLRWLKEFTEAAARTQSIPA